MPRVTPTTPGAAAAVVRFSKAADEFSGRWSNRFDYRWVLGAFVPIPDADLLQLATDVYNAVEAQFVPRLSAASQLVRVDAYDLGDPSRAPQTYSEVDVGGGTAEAAPPDSALVVTLRTAKIGRSFHGRSYFSGWQSGDVATNGQTWDAAAGTAAKATVDAILAPDGGSMRLGVLSLRTNGAYRANGVITDVTSTVVRPVEGGVVAPVVSQKLRLTSQKKRRTA